MPREVQAEEARATGDDDSAGWRCLEGHVRASRRSPAGSRVRERLPIRARRAEAPRTAARVLRSIQLASSHTSTGASGRGLRLRRSSQRKCEKRHAEIVFQLSVEQARAVLAPFMGEAEAFVEACRDLI